jgi:hypothetical protein
MEKRVIYLRQNWTQDLHQPTENEMMMMVDNNFVLVKM